MGVGVVAFLSQGVNAAIEGQGVWLFDETGQIVGDSSANKNDGYLGNSPGDITQDATRDSNGRFGSCIGVGGPPYTYAMIPDSPSLNITGNAISVEAWVNSDTDLGPGLGPEYMHILSKDSYRIIYTRHSGTISAAIHIDRWTPELSSPVSWQAGEWHHVAMTYDGVESRLYIDGSLKSTKAAKGNIDDSESKTLCIGAHYNGQWGWVGKIDEVRVLNRALAASEIEHDAKNSIKMLEGKKVVENKGKVKSKSTIGLSNANTFPEITFFETQEDIDKWKVGDGTIITQSAGYASQGKYSARITFLPRKGDHYAGLGFMDGKGFASRDWSNYAMLAFDVYNPNKFGIGLTFTIRDSRRTKIWRGLPHEAIYWDLFGIPPLKEDDAKTSPVRYFGWKMPWEMPADANRTTIHIPLVEPVRFMASEEPWKTYISDVENFSIELFFNDVKTNYRGVADKEITFYLDNVRLLTRDEAEPYLWTRVEMASGTRAPLEEQIRILSEESTPAAAGGGKNEVIAEIDIPYLPFFETVSIQTKVANLPYGEGIPILEVSLEKDGKIIRTFPHKEISFQSGKEIMEKHTFDVKGVEPGRYTLSARLLKGDRVIQEKRKLIRIYGPYTPVEERDFNYVLLEGRLVVGYPDAFDNADVFRNGWGPVKITYPWPSRLEKFVEYQLPFIICEGLFAYAADEPYELYRERARGIVDEMEKIGGDYFLGVWIGEIGDSIVANSQAVSEQETRLGKANAYIKVVKQIKEDALGLPPDKIFMFGSYYVGNQALDAEAGANVIFKESGVLGSFTQQMSLTRGVARSFRKRYGDVIATDGLTGEAHFNMSPPADFKWDIKTGRYDPQNKRKLAPPVKHEWSLEDAYKIFIERYYNGVNYLVTSNEHPHQSGEMVFNFLDFIKENPRGKDIVSSVAIMESKGNYLGSLHPLTAEETAIKSDCFEVYGLWKWRYPDNIPYKEEMDFLYLNQFYPNLTDDMVLYKQWWTGTTYGAVDRIYPAMKLEDMRKYNAIVFMGFHRMDSVRKDFLNDLMKYVKDGGIIVIAADQMRDSNEEFNLGELKKLLGVSITPDYRLRIKDYIDVVEATPFNIKRGRYPITPEVKFKGEEESWVYRVTAEGADVIAKDSQGIPVLVANKYGKGHVFLFTSPTLSMIPPVGKSPLISDVIDKVCRYKSLPVMLSPGNEDVEFLIARTEDREATIFVMNHGEKAWEGDIIVNLARSGLSSDAGEEISARICQGYKAREVTPKVVREGDSLIIKDIRVEGDTSEPASYNYLPWLKPYSEQLELKTFCSYRQASFALVRLGGK